MTARPFSVAAFRSAWLDPSLTLDQIGQKFGVHRDAVSKRGQRLGLPPRSPGPRGILPTDELLQMHALGMSHPAIADHFGCHWMTVLNTLRRLKAPSRGKGRRSSMTAGEYRALRDAGQLSRSATPAARRDALVVAMTHANVLRADIARATGLNPSSVTKRARKLGVPPRRAGRMQRLTLQDFIDLQMAQVMAKTHRKAG